ncbi:MAG: arylsulfatase [Verrucomicrobiota bacterium]|nr:arylsulfatase [Verrucomicrobiota bacterium]
MKSLRFLAAALLALVLSAFPGVAQTARPNIIFILADDLGLGDVGCYGNKVVQTPHIDRLAAEGMQFLRAYSGSAVCAPSRSVLMTGKHSGHCNRRANQSKNGLIPMAPGEVTVAEALKQAGYATGGFGKWGLGNPGTTGVPEKQGFDLWFGYYDQVHAHSYFPAYLVRNSERVPLPGNEGGKTGQYSHELIVGETLNFIEANQARPFLVYAAWTLPHGKHEIPSDAPYSDRPWPQPVKNHAAMITRLDADIGRLLQKLKELGLEERTLILFSSDNGADGPGVQTFNGTAGLRGRKRHLYEGGIRAPFIARWSGKIQPGTKSELLTSQVDFLATAADLAGAATPDETDGISISPTLLGQPQTAKHDHLYWEIYEGPVPFQQAVRLGDCKGYRTALKGPLELYDLRKDPAEGANVAAQHPEIVEKITSLMAAEHVRSEHWDPVDLPGDKPAKKRAAKQAREK